MCFACVCVCVALDNMYEFEGEDYSKCNDADKKTFDQLLAGKSARPGGFLK